MRLKYLLPLLLASVAVCNLSAQVEKEEQRSRHRFGVQIPVWFNAHASFSGRAATNPGPDNGDPATDRFYDDGFMRVDSTGNAVSPAPPAAYSFNRSSFFGYQGNAQVSNNPGATPAMDPQGGTLALHSVALNGGRYTEGHNSEVSPGVEFFYRYELGRQKDWSFHIESAFSYQHFSWDESDPTQANASVLTDTYALGGVVLGPGLAPYTGVFTPVPGVPLIGSTPARSQATVPAMVTGNRALNMNTLLFRLGPTIEWKPDPRWRLEILGGGTLGWSYSHLEFDETIAVADPTVPLLSQSGNSWDSHFGLGAYAALGASYDFAENWTWHGQVRRVWQRSFSHDGGSRVADIDVSKAFSVIIGFSREF